MRRINIMGCLLAVVVAAAAVSVAAAPGPAPAGERTVALEIRSEVLGETVPVNVYLPSGYRGSGGSYPVLYVLEGGLYERAMTGVADARARLGAAPELIVVFVGTADRWRDFTPTRAGVPGGETIPTSGGADGYRAFLSDELLPRIGEEFRTKPFRLLFGHSIAGLGAAVAMFEEPGLFGACIATSPSVWWDGEVARSIARTALEARDGFAGSLFLAIGNEDETMQAPLRRFAGMLAEQSAAGFRWRLKDFPEAEHQEVPLAAFDAGLDFVFDGWALPDSAFAAGLDAVDAHYAALSKRFGYPVDVPEAVLNRLGYRLLGAGDVDGAVSIFERNAVAHPVSANVHDSLGEALLARGDTAGALARYLEALALDPENPRIRSTVERLQRETSPEAAACLREVEGLHAFFRGWYRGEIENTDAGFARLAGAIAEDFTLITPSGFAANREQLLSLMRAEWGTRRDMEMRVQSFRFKLAAGGTYLLTYEEYGKSGDREKVTLITAVMRESKRAPTGIEWVHLHETELR